MKYFLFSLCFLSSITYATQTCPVRARAVFDVGSGSTKMAVALIEVCPDEIRVQKFLDESSSTDVALEAGKDKDGKISDAALEKLTAALKTLKEKAIALVKQAAPQLKQIEVGAAGTHAVRTAANLPAIVAAASKAGIPLTALTQEQEGLNGFAGAHAKGADRGCPSGSRVLVWDVGGGSMQWILGDATPHVAGLPLGAEGFKTHLLAALKRPEAKPACEAKGPSPNPIGKTGIAIARKAAAEDAKALPAEFKNLKNICAIGIGGVHTKAIEGALKKNWAQLEKCVCHGKASCTHTDKQYSAVELNCLADQLALKSDCDEEIKGPYSATNVSNLFMISGFMKALGLKEIHTENVNMGHGLAVDRKLVKFETQAL